MELFAVYLSLMIVAVLSGLGARACWVAGYRRAILGVLAAVVGAGAVCLGLASVATQGFLAGLGEFLIGLGLLLGPGAGLLIGLVSLWSRPVALVLGAVHVLGLTYAFFGPT